MGKIGKLTVICGPMFAGKTTKLIELVNKSDKKKVVFKPVIDNRYDEDSVCTHDGKKIECYVVESLANIIDIYIKEKPEVIAIDEVQFFNEDIKYLIDELIDRNVEIIIGGLDMDFRREPFEITGYLLGKA